MTDTTRPKCEGVASSFYGHCERSATVEYNGKWYCWQHDPARAKVRAAERTAEAKRIDAENEAKWARWDRERAVGLRPDQVAELSEEQLTKLAKAGGLLKILEKL